jgi:hypothetical protein
VVGGDSFQDAVYFCFILIAQDYPLPEMQKYDFYATLGQIQPETGMIERVRRHVMPGIIRVETAIICLFLNVFL